MCRNIRLLFNFEPPVSDDEVRAAALQFVRKVTGSQRPAKANEAAFNAAVDEISRITTTLVRESLIPLGPPKDREAEAVKARARGRQRDARRVEQLLAGVATKGEGG